MPAMPNASYWYIGSTKWSAVARRPTTPTAVAVGHLTTVESAITPNVGDERVWVCIVAGTTTSGFIASWNITKGSKTTEASGVVWMECTGQPPVNGDATNTQDWNDAKSNTVALGQIIQRNNGASYQICTTAGTAGSGSEPAFSDTAGVTTNDNSVVWTSLGAVGNFSAWGAPHARLGNAIASGWGGAGNTFYISNNHAETQPSFITYNVPGTAAAPCKYLCVSDAAAPPTAVGTTATISTTGSGSSLTLSTGSVTTTGNFYMYGVTFNIGAGANGASIFLASYGGVFENCNFNLTNTNTSSFSRLGHNSQATPTPALQIYRNCTFSFGATAQYVALYLGEIQIIGGSIALTGTAPTTAFNAGTGGGGIGNGSLLVRDCDLSGITGNLVDATVRGSYPHTFANCRLGAGVTLATGAVYGPAGITLRVHNCDSSATNYRMYTLNYYGASQQSTSTYNDAGATDGTQRISWKVDTSSVAAFSTPFACEQIFQWVDSTGSALTATVEIAGSATLNDDDIWMDIEYLGNASYPLGSLATCRKSTIMSSNAAVPSSSATWTGSPAVTQKLEVTFTPQMKGPIKARVYVAKPSITVYVDPLITVA